MPVRDDDLDGSAPDEAEVVNDLEFAGGDQLDLPARAAPRGRI